MPIGSAHLEIADQFSYSRHSDELYLEVSDPEASNVIVLTFCITMSRLIRIYQSLFHHIRSFCECILCWSFKNRYCRTGTSQGQGQVKVMSKSGHDHVKVSSRSRSGQSQMKVRSRTKSSQCQVKIRSSSGQGQVIVR